MTKGIYFLDKNVNLLSDIESFFVVNDMVSYRGGAGLLQQAKNELAGRNDVDVIVISDNLVDATCIEALKALMSHPAKKIVALRNKDEMLRTKIEEHAIVISYPFSCNLIEETIKRMADAPEYSDDDLDRIAESNIDSDNPFFSAPTFGREKPKAETPKKKNATFQERLKNIQINRNKQNIVRLFPQRVIAVHSQKGGVGKSTVSRELAIAIRTAHIERDMTEYVPKVCLCDFDFEASDIAVLMGLNPTVNIMNWCDDIEYEASRTWDRIEDVRFTDNAILDRYLVKHESGVYVLSAPEVKTDCFKIKKEYIHAIIENLKLCDFDIILLDTGPNILDYTLTALSLCTEVFAVCNCDMLSSRRLDSMMADVFSKINGFDFAKIKLLVNNVNEKSSVTAQDVANALNLPLVGVLPYYPDIVDINNEGHSVFYNRKKAVGKAAEYANAFRNIARDLVCSTSAEPKQGSRGAVDGLDSVHRRGSFNLFRK